MLRNISRVRSIGNFLLIFYDIAIIVSPWCEQEISDTKTEDVVKHAT